MIFLISNLEIRLPEIYEEFLVFESRIKNIFYVIHLYHIKLLFDLIM